MDIPDAKKPLGRTIPNDRVGLVDEDELTSTTRAVRSSTYDGQAPRLLSSVANSLTT